MVFTTVLLIAFVAVVGLYKTGIYRFDFFKDVYKKIALRQFFMMC